jgi:hypothetical protein
VNYEISHDVLAPAILGLRIQYIQTQEQAMTELRAKEQQRRAEEQTRAGEQARVARRLRRLVQTPMSVPLLTVFFAMGAGCQARRAQRESKAEEQARLAEEAREAEVQQRMKAEQALHAGQSVLAAAQLAKASTPDQPAAAGVTDLLGKAQTEYTAAQHVKEPTPAKRVPPIETTGPQRSSTFRFRIRINRQAHSKYNRY